MWEYLLLPEHADEREACRHRNGKVASCRILKADQEDVVKIYQAAPLFSEAEITWHRSFAKMLAAAGHDVVTALLDVSHAGDGSA